MSVRLDSNNPELYRELIDKYDTWMLDCDGVLWHGDRLIDGAVQVLEILRSHSTPNYKKKFDGLGIEAHVVRIPCLPTDEYTVILALQDEVFGSAYAAAVYLSSVLNFPKDKRVVRDRIPRITHSLCQAKYHQTPQLAAVLIGLDTSINYTKLSRAFRYLHSNPECFFLATNEDSTFPSEKGLLPGAGAILAPLVTALGPNRPVTAIGKPKQLDVGCNQSKVRPKSWLLCCFHAAFGAHNFDPKRTIMVGDRLNTDIQFGKSGGLATLLVLTGITSEDDLTGPNPSSIVPDYVTASIGDLRNAVV
ncbi:2-phosphoglycolate phosphatase [Lactarius sanguifluus]|nr:2-phosphoglycolate phosphatase [Lactarius sanguifluus]